MEIEILKFIDYQSDNDLINCIMDLIGPSYKTAGTHIAKDIEICNELYVMQSENRQMLAIFMVGYHSINELNCCYLGLSACKEEYKNKGLVKRLYLEFAKDCLDKEHQINDRIYTYWTTATPIVYYWFTKYFNNVEPDIHGDCTTTGLKILQTIAKEKYSKAQFEYQTPFILRQAAQQINYSVSERQRITKAVKDLDLRVFEKYNINEMQGDRFLMFGFCPMNDNETNAYKSS